MNAERRAADVRELLMWAKRELRRNNEIACWLLLLWWAMLGGDRGMK